MFTRLNSPQSKPENIMSISPTTAKLNTAYTAQSPVSDSTNPVVQKTPGLSNTEIAGGTILGTGAGVALGAFGYPKTKFNTLDELFKSSELSSVMDKIKDVATKDAKDAKLLYNGIKTQCDFTKKTLEQLSKEDTILLEAAANQFSAKELLDYGKYEQVETETKKILEFVNSKKGKEMSALDYQIEWQQLFAEEADKTDDAISKAKAALIAECPELVKEKVTITDEYINQLKANFDADLKEAAKKKASLDELFKSASDNKIKKSVLYDYRKKEITEEFLEMAGSEKKKELFEALKEYMPKKRVKTGIIGGVAGLLAIGSALVAYSKITAKKQV